VADGERLDRARFSFGKERGVGAGVDAARQKDADGHIADLAKPHRRPQLGEDALGNLFLISADERLNMVPDFPVALLPDRAMLIDSKPATVGQLANSSEERLRRRRRQE